LSLLYNIWADFFQDIVMLIQLINNVRITQSDKINLKIESCVKTF